jgi:hypothetical protein
MLTERFRQLHGRQNLENPRLNHEDNTENFFDILVYEALYSSVVAPKSAGALYAW